MSRACTGGVAGSARLQGRAAHCGAMATLGLAGYASSSSGSDDASAEVLQNFDQAPRNGIVASSSPAAAAETAPIADPGGDIPVTGTFGAIVAKRRRGQARKGGLPLFYKPTEEDQNSGSDDEVRFVSLSATVHCFAQHLDAAAT